MHVRSVKKENQLFDVGFSKTKAKCPFYPTSSIKIRAEAIIFEHQTICDGSKTSLKKNG